MASFDLYAPKLLKAEGGFVNNPNDKGGAMNKGVTYKVFQKRWHEFYPEWRTMQGFGPWQAFMQMDDKQWRAIMKGDYWDKVKADEIKDQTTAELVADWAINSGQQKAARGLQSVLNQLFNAKLDVDGLIGPKTLAAANNADANLLNSALLKARQQFYKDIKEADPSQAGFALGWANRLADLVGDAIKNPTNRGNATVALAFCGVGLIFYFALKK